MLGELRDAWSKIARATSVDVILSGSARFWPTRGRRRLRWRFFILLVELVGERALCDKCVTTAGLEPATPRLEV